MVCAVIAAAILATGMPSVLDAGASVNTGDNSVTAISSAEDFAKIDGSNENFVLAADISVKEPITSFGGVLDGNGYTVTLDDISASGNKVALIRTLSGTVKNLSVVGTLSFGIDKNSGASYVGGVVAYLTATGVVSDVHCGVTMTQSGNGGKGDKALRYAAGVVGSAEEGATVKGCFFTGKLQVVYDTNKTSPEVAGICNPAVAADSGCVYVKDNVYYKSDSSATAVRTDENVAHEVIEMLRTDVSSNNGYWLYVDDKLVTYDRLSGGVGSDIVPTDPEGNVSLPELGGSSKKLIGWQIKCNGTGVCKFYKPGETVNTDGDDVLTSVFADIGMSEKAFIRTTAVDGLKCEGKINMDDFRNYTEVVNANCDEVGGVKVGVKLKMIVFLKNAVPFNKKGEAIVNGMALDKEDFIGKTFVEVECDAYVGSSDDGKTGTVGVTIVNLKPEHYESEYGYMFFVEANYNNPDGTVSAANYYCPVQIGCANKIADETIASYYDDTNGELLCNIDEVSVIDKGEEKTTFIHILAKYAKKEIKGNAKNKLDKLLGL